MYFLGTFYITIHRLCSQLRLSLGILKAVLNFFLSWGGTCDLASLPYQLCLSQLKKWKKTIVVIITTTIVQVIKTPLRGIFLKIKDFAREKSFVNDNMLLLVMKK